MLGKAHRCNAICANHQQRDDDVDEGQPVGEVGPGDRGSWVSSGSPGSSAPCFHSANLSLPRATYRCIYVFLSLLKTLDASQCPRRMFTISHCTETLRSYCACPPLCFFPLPILQFLEHNTLPAVSGPSHSISVACPFLFTHLILLAVFPRSSSPRSLAFFLSRTLILVLFIICNLRSSVYQVTLPVILENHLPPSHFPQSRCAWPPPAPIPSPASKCPCDSPCPAAFSWGFCRTYVWWCSASRPPSGHWAGTQERTQDVEERQ